MSRIDDRIARAAEEGVIRKYAIQPRRGLGYDFSSIMRGAENLSLERQFRREEEAKADRRHAAREAERAARRLSEDYGVPIVLDPRVPAGVVVIGARRGRA